MKTNNSILEHCSDIFKDMLIRNIHTQFYAQRAVQFGINHIPLQSDPYEPAHLKKKARRLSVGDR